MQKTLMAATVAAMFLVPNIAAADPNAAGGAAAGAAIGAGAGFAVGGPVGAAVGAGVGGTVGAAASPPSTQQEVIIERQEPSVRQRSCVRDSRGTVVCEEIRR